MSMNTTSVTNILNTFVPLLAYFQLNNQTFNVNYTHKTSIYEFDLKTIHIISASGFTEKYMEYIPGTDKVHVRIAGIDLATTVTADLWGLYFIPFKASAVNVTNVTVDFVVQSTSDDGVHWALADNATLTVGKVDI